MLFQSSPGASAGRHVPEPVRDEQGFTLFQSSPGASAGRHA